MCLPRELCLAGYYTAGLLNESSKHGVSQDYGVTHKVFTFEASIEAAVMENKHWILLLSYPLVLCSVRT